jgi:hypothetical protein
VFYNYKKDEKVKEEIETLINKYNIPKGILTEKFSDFDLFEYIDYVVGRLQKNFYSKFKNKRKLMIKVLNQH